jgi:DNA-binding NarL/FixJ family response regulator
MTYLWWFRLRSDLATCNVIKIVIYHSITRGLREVDHVRIVVVSDRGLSRAALVSALEHMPDAHVVAEVDRLCLARCYCEKGEADVVICDALAVENGAPDLSAFPGEPVIEDFSPHLAACLADGTSHEDHYPWRLAAGHVEELSSRERQVFTLLGMGFSNQHAARLLGVTEPTIKTHVGRVLAKLHLESRLQAGLAALVYLARRSGRTDDRAAAPR